jgi:hypothetical protein
MVSSSARSRAAFARFGAELLIMPFPIMGWPVIR